MQSTWIVANRSVMAEKLVIIGSGTCCCGRRTTPPPIQSDHSVGAIIKENPLGGTLPLGQLNLTTDVENFPVFAVGSWGPISMMAMCEQGRALPRVESLSKLIIVSARSAAAFSTLIRPAARVLQLQAIVISTGREGKLAWPELRTIYKITAFWLKQL